MLENELRIAFLRNTRRTSVLSLLHASMSSEETIGSQTSEVFLPENGKTESATVLFRSVATTDSCTQKKKSDAFFARGRYGMQ